MALQAQLSQLSWYQSVLVVGVIYIILWVLSGVPNAFRDFRCRWILSRYPLVNPKWDTEAKRQFSSESQMALIKKGIAMGKGGPFRMNCLTGPCLCIPHKYEEEYKNIPALDLPSTTKFDFPLAYPGFEGPRTSVGESALVVRDAVKVELHGMLPTAISLVAKETPRAVGKVFGTPDEWTEAGDIASMVLKCVGQFTSLVFLGRKYVDEPEWQRISVDYSIFLYRAAFSLMQWPSFLWSLVHRFVPACRKLREEVAIARNLLQPAVDQGRREAVQRQTQPQKKSEDSVGGRPSRENPPNSIDWFTAAAKNYRGMSKSFDYMAGEFTLAMLSNRTTSMLGGVAMGLLVSHPEYIPLLRAEVIEVLSTTKSFDKSTMYKLKLMDSFLKESGRLQSFPTQSRRVALEDITLHDGSVIPKGAYCVIAPTPMMDPDYYGPDPSRFDGHRFLRKREAAAAAGLGDDGNSRYQFVSTSAEEITFSSGIWACPGRFFASYMLKCLVSYLVLHYDFQVPAGLGAEGGKSVVGSAYSRSIHGQTFQYKARKPEVDWLAVCK